MIFNNLAELLPEIRNSCNILYRCRTLSWNCYRVLLIFQMIQIHVESTVVVVPNFAPLFLHRTMPPAFVILEPWLQMERIVKVLNTWNFIRQIGTQSTAPNCSHEICISHIFFITFCCCVMLFSMIYYTYSMTQHKVIQQGLVWYALLLVTLHFLKH